MAELEKMDEEGLLPEEKEEVPLFTAARPGCTPFEFIEFTDETLEHNIDIIVSPHANFLLIRHKIGATLMSLNWVPQLPGGQIEHLIVAACSFLLSLQAAHCLAMAGAAPTLDYLPFLLLTPKEGRCVSALSLPCRLMLP